MTEDMVVVGISEFKTAQAPQTLVTYALGSCIGISLYDERTNIGGMAHIMLPDSRLFQGNGRIHRMKFADTALVDLVSDMMGRGAALRHITAKIAGGANMFHMEGDGMAAIGKRNIESVKCALHEMRIPLIGEDTGKDFGRTVFFELMTGRVRVQSLGREIRVM